MTARQSDIALWDAFKKGDSEACGQLFRRHYEALYRFGYKFTQDPEILEDCIQELFLELWQSKSRTEIQSVKAYLFKSLKYKIFRVLQKKSGKNTTSITDDLLFELSHETLLVSQEETQERINKVNAAFSKLSNRQKEIIYLKFYQELNYEEVSEIMNINYQAARNLLSQAIKSLKKIMTALGAVFFVIP